MAIKIEIESWKRKRMFEFFRDFEDPFFNVTAPLDVGGFYEFCKLRGYSFAIALLYLSQQAANSIEEFRTRISGEDVLLFDRVEATQTILLDDETFAFCYFEHAGSLEEFDEKGREAVERYKKLGSFEVEDHRQDLIYYSVIPWISFTSFKHASRLDGRRSVPRIVFGKMYGDGAGRRIPVSVEVHHALADGIHAGRYYERFQELLGQYGES